MESEMVRYKLYDRLHADKANGIKRMVFVFCIIIIIANGILARLYYNVGIPLWMSSVALVIAAVLLLLQTRATLGIRDEVKFTGPNATQLTTYGMDLNRVINLLEQLKTTKLLFQGARNKLSLDGTTSSEAAPVFDLNIYQLELRLIERIQNQERLRSRQEAEAFIASKDTTAATLVKYLKLYKDTDYPLFIGILKAYTETNEPTTSLSSTNISVDVTNETSGLLNLRVNEMSPKNINKLDFMLTDFIALRTSLDRMATTDHTPYIKEVTDHLAPLVFILYVILFIIGYFGYKWAIYRTSMLIVTLTVSILVTAYIFYYFYLG